MYRSPRGAWMHCTSLPIKRNNMEYTCIHKYPWADA